MKIALSIGSNLEKYKPYSAWLANSDSSLESVELCYKFMSIDSVNINELSGVVLCGGLDIEPARHGRGELNDTVIFNRERDEFEIKLIQKALEKRIPILAICRGAQALCVALGGSLIVDIPSEIGMGVEHRRVNGFDSVHNVTINANSFLRKIIGESSGIVNSLHHEAVRIVPQEMEPCAYADDGVIEGYEWKSPFGKQFICAVQWHPEKMDWTNPFSKNIAERFLFESETYSQLFNRNFQ